MRKNEIVVLIADDDIQVSTVLAEAFAKKGITTVRIAETLDVFLKLMYAYSHRPRAVVTNPWSLTFPGWSVLTCIEGQGKHDILSLAWTAEPNRDKEERARRRGAYELFQKNEEGIEEIVSFVETTPVWFLLEGGNRYDDLTEIYNRRGFTEAVKEKLRFIKRVGSPAASCFMMADLDYFKKINDHGHHVGDRALKMAAVCLRESVRFTDVVGRYSGDEFVLFVTGVQEMVAIIEMLPKIKASLAGLHLENDDGVRINLSLTIGTSQVNLEDLNSLGVDEIVERGIEQADKDMLRIKGDRR